MNDNQVLYNWATVLVTWCLCLTSVWLIASVW